jgi:hypothetical protein
MKNPKVLAWALAALVCAAPVGAAHASVNLVTNGDFETNGGMGQLGYNTTIAGWSTGASGQASYTFLFAPGAADTTGASGQFGNLQLWGPNNGSNNGLTTSPSGGYFLASDGAFQVSAVTQTINGLTAGQSYNLSFSYAGAQQSGFSGVTTEAFQVSLGSQTQETPILSNADHGFTGWQSDTMTFTATSATETLSFLAQGTPNGEPPFTLLDGVSLVAAPGPTPGGGFLGLAFLMLAGAAAKAHRA